MNGTITSLQFLGTSNSIPDLEHGNTHMLLSSESHNILIDCPGDVIQRMLMLKIPQDHITELILTHFHPDHSGGVSLLLMNMWLNKRTKPLTIIANEHTLTALKQLMDASGWDSWPNFYPVFYVEIPDDIDIHTPIYESEDVRITTTFVKHFLPTNALRFDFLKTNNSIAYSSDTEPCQNFIDLAKGADIIIHESTGSGMGHSTSMEAANVANQAGAKELYLVHYQARGEALKRNLRDAQEIFNGTVYVAEDFMEIQITRQRIGTKFLRMPE
jgi:ribonuclease Z